MSIHPIPMNRQDNLEALFNNGRTVILPIDHGCAIPVPGLENPFEIIDKVNGFVSIATRLYEAYVKEDATLVEINPLILMETGAVAVDAAIWRNA